jgi:hypothetical protein
MRAMRFLLSITIVVSLSHHVLGHASAAIMENTTDARISDKDAAVLVQRFEQWAAAELRKMEPVGELYLQPDSGGKETDSYSWGRLVLASDGDKDRLVNRLPPHIEELLSPDPQFDARRYVLRFVRHDSVNGIPVSIYETHPRGDYDGFEGQVALDQQGFVWQYVGSRRAVDSFLTRWSGQWRRRRFVYSGWRARLHGGSIYTTDVFIQQVAAPNNPPEFSRRGRMRLWNYGKTRAEQARAELQVVESVERPRRLALGPSADENERHWMRDVENYVLEVLTRDGYLAPEGTFETRSCAQVISNLLAVTRRSEAFDPPVRCRVLLSSRLDLRLLGHTMLISVGSLDTAGDEATVATILAHGLAEIVTKPTQITPKVAFAKRPALELLAALETQASDEEAVNKEALTMLSRSLYAPKLEQAGLFLDALNDVTPRLSSLVPHTFVDHVGDTAGVLRQSEWMRRRPVYDPLRSGHFSALPLGSRMALNRETNQVELLRAPLVPMLGKSFGVVPPYPYSSDGDVGASAAPRAASN